MACSSTSCTMPCARETLSIKSTSIRFMHHEPLRYLRYRAYRLDVDISCGHVLLPSNDLRDSLLKYVVDISVKWRDDAREYFFVTDCDFTYSWLMAPLGAYRSLASVGNLCS